MIMATHYKPDDMPTMSSVLPGGSKLIEFTTKVFGAKVQRSYPMPGGGIAHAEVRFGDSLLMTGDPMGDHVIAPGTVSIYVPDVDTVYARALEAGATSKEAPANQFYGDRSARVVDPFGNNWSIAQHVEDVAEDEMKRRMDEMMKGS
jgi:PhnB protein